MNVKKMAGTALTAAALFSGTHSIANQSPPRGPDVDALAGNCAIGPYRQTSKAGPYNPLCATMPDAEKCLAFIKQHMNDQGELSPVARFEDERGRAEYCLATFRAELLGTAQEG